MIPSSEPSLDAQGVAIRQQMRAQRQRIAEQLVSDTHRRGAYPRSVTFRLLQEQPLLLRGLLQRLTGARRARLLLILMALIRILRAYTTSHRSSRAALSHQPRTIAAGPPRP